MSKSTVKTDITALTAALFCAAELALGILVQRTSGDLNTAVSYGSVILAMLFCLVLMKKSADYAFTQAGLVFTALADLFLVVIQPMLKLPAMIFFTGAQLCYAVRLHLGEKNAEARKNQLLVRISLSVAALLLTAVVLGPRTDALALISLFYYANLVSNIVASMAGGRRTLMLTLGLICFALCDAQIGLSVMAESYLPVAEGSLIYNFIHPGFNFAWAMYVPSQTLIAMSLLKLPAAELSHEQLCIDELYYENTAEGAEI